MKKTVSLLLALVFVFSFSAVAFADSDLLNYKWEQVQDAVKNDFPDGNTWPINAVNATIWLPAEYQSLNPSQEGLDASCIGLFTLDNGSYVIVNYTDSANISLDLYYSYCLQQGFDVGKILINDIPVIEQDNPSNETLSLTYLTQEGKLLQFVLSPLSSPINGLIMSSILPTDLVEEDAPVETEPVVPVNPVSGLISK